MLANGVFRFPITLLYCLAGLVIGTLAFNDPQLFAQIPKDSPDWLMPIFILNYLPHGLIGLLVVAILAAAMSSLSSAINSLSAVSLEDYFKLTRREKKEGHYLKSAKVAGRMVVISNSMANGTASSYDSQINPPPSRNPTKAGAEIKLTAESCVAMIERRSGFQFKLLPAKK